MSYEYHAPATLAEAIEVLARLGPDAHVMAGGTALVLLMKQGLVRPAHVVGIGRLAELRGIARDGDGSLRIGALATHREAERSPFVRAHCAALGEAFGKVATVRIRNQATVGGNLAHADPAQDPPPMLLALDAEVVIASPHGERVVPLDGFFRGYFETVLEPGELLVAVRVPLLLRGSKATYLKFLPRTADDYATVSVAARLRLDADGRVADVRVALGAAGPTPLRARRVEGALAGELPTRERVREAAALVREEVDPLDDARGSAAYKREMARVWTERALASLVA